MHVIFVPNGVVPNYFKEGRKMEDWAIPYLFAIDPLDMYIRAHFTDPWEFYKRFEW